MIRSLEEIKKEQEEAGPKPPKIFLFLAALMVAVAVGAYLFQEEIFDLTYSDNTFVIVIVAAIVLALFFLYCYRFPRFGLTLLGHKAEFGNDKEDLRSVTYDIFQGETGSDEKIRHSRRKRDRHMRRLTAKYSTRPEKGEPSRETPPESDKSDD